MTEVVRVKAGWIKRLPSGNIGPFKTEREALNAYANPEGMAKASYTDRVVDGQKKGFVKKFDFKEEKKEDK